jgi:hypothetical protein
MRTYWLAWFILTFPLGFLIPETYALASGHPEWTLSAAIWSLEDLVPGQQIWHWNAFHLLFIAMLVTLFVWLTGHFAFGWWR